MNAVAPLIPCIVSGGSGTRLWPVSRESMPKPFMRLADDQSLLQKTFLRIAGLPDVARLLTVTNRDLLFRTLDDYRAVNRSGLAQDLLLEPVGRNTAPAIAAAALHVQEHFGDQAQLLILPADHLIRDEQAFAAAVAEARGLAAQGYLVTFGITPERAETGFGYIEQGAPLGNGFRVARFVEKPDQATAQSYLDSGKYLWNAGMFCFQAATVLQELERHAPEVLIAARAALADGSSLENGQCRQRELAAGAFAEAPDISVDYALMERSDKVAVVPCSIGWSDIGSWQALRELSAADENGNQVRGESVLHDVSNCYIDSPKRLVGAVGVHDLIIVDTPDALLVADAARSQDVKFVAQELKRRGHDAFRLHRTVSRPWGTYTVLNDGSIYYPFIGRIQAAHRTPQEIANELTTKLAPIYREPRVTVNINQAPGNTVFVGGAVRNPSAVPIPAANNMEQAILGAGGILPVGDARRVALMREDSEGRYHAYFLDFSQLMKIGPEGRKPLAMQRGDIVFVPKSMVGDRIEGVDVYLNQLLPFAKSIGVGVSYTVNNDR